MPPHLGYGRQVSVILRPEQPGDLPFLTGEDAPFDDFGPREPRTRVRAADFHESGSLVVLDENGDVAGGVSWHWNHWGPNPESRCPMIGIWLRSSARGRGIGRLAQSQLAGMLFEHTPTNRVEAHTDVANIAEQRSLEAAGFQREGLVRAAQWRAGAYHDGYLYSILRSEWEAATRLD
ncbi:MAG: GNAT family N-acetyltransferase [Acidobacteriota bacterium]|nr:GNAT family N-acetyltransferase [Acidobacteriota bacterium]